MYQTLIINQCGAFFIVDRCSSQICTDPNHILLSTQSVIRHLRVAVLQCKVYAFQYPRRSCLPAFVTPRAATTRVLKQVIMVPGVAAASRRWTMFASSLLTADQPNNIMRVIYLQLFTWTVDWYALIPNALLFATTRFILVNNMILLFI